jgi:hypothetical protein
MAQAQKFRRPRDVNKERVKILVVLLLIIIGYFHFVPDHENQRPAAVAHAQN